MPVDKRKKLVGIGGHRIRALISETGADLYNVSDDRMSIFAPTKAVMENVMKRVETLMAEEEPEVFCSHIIRARNSSSLLTMRHTFG